MRVTPKGTLLSCNCFHFTQELLTNVIYGCVNFYQEILIELITENKSGVKYHLKTTLGCIEV